MIRKKIPISETPSTRAASASSAGSAQGSIVVTEIRRYCAGLDLQHEVYPSTYDLMA
jgi:hypothetical protein